MKTVQEMYLDKLRREEMPRLKAKARANVEAQFRTEQAKLEAELEAKLEGGQQAEHNRWREVLRRILTDKFGSMAPEHEIRIETAPLDELQNLITRTATADSIEVVFASRDA
jgi:hypothetical protein